MWDGIVIGGGLAGLIAGIRASEKGKRILIISEGIGNLAYSLGVLDFGDIENLLGQEKHPYALLGKKAIRTGMDYFQKLFPNTRSTWEATQTLLTPLGSQRTAGIIPDELNAEGIQDANHIVIMAPEGMKDFFPEIIKTNLEKTYPHSIVDIYPFRLSSFEAWYALGKPVKGIDYARFWQSEQGIAELKRIMEKMISKSFFKVQKTKRGKKPVILFPGLAASFSIPIRKVLSEMPIPVIEIPTFPPSVTGHYLYDSLKRKFKSLGGELIIGSRVQKIESEGKRCTKAVVANNVHSTTFAAHSFIIATGGILGGGIRVTNETAEETLLNLPLYIPMCWTKKDFFEKQPFAYIGIEVDNELRPFNPINKDTILENVWVVGRGLPHWDPWYENCGGGVSLVTGLFAGEKI